MKHDSVIQPHIPSKLAFILLFIISIFIVSIESADKCTHLYTDHTIDYISNNIDDPFVYYLGDKTTTTECQDSCISLNYLCDKSTNNVFLYSPPGETSDWQFNNHDCSATLTHSNGETGAGALLTSDITANEYIIETEITVRSGVEGGIYFKAQQQSPYDYWIMLSISSNTVDIGYTTNGDWKEIQRTSATLHYNQKYTLRIHVIGNTFITYLDGVQKGKQVVIDDTKWTGNCAGLYTYDSQTVYHSFKVIYPDESDNEGKPVCAAYVYNKDDGACYGYYGRNTVQLESSISSDAGIVYDSSICPPIPTTTTAPAHTAERTPQPSVYTTERTNPPVYSTNHTLYTVEPIASPPPPLYTTERTHHPVYTTEPTDDEGGKDTTKRSGMVTTEPTVFLLTSSPMTSDVTTKPSPQLGDASIHRIITVTIMVFLVMVLICVIDVFYLSLKRESLRKQTEEIVIVIKANVNKDNNGKLENDGNEPGLVEMRYRRTVEGARSPAQSLGETDGMDAFTTNPNIADDEFIV